MARQPPPRRPPPEDAGGDGPVKIQIGVRGSVVMIEFPSLIAFLGLSKDDANRFAATILRAAKTLPGAEPDLPPEADPKSDAYQNAAHITDGGVGLVMAARLDAGDDPGAITAGAVNAVVRFLSRTMPPPFTPRAVLAALIPSITAAAEQAAQKLN